MSDDAYEYDYEYEHSMDITTQMIYMYLTSKLGDIENTIERKRKQEWIDNIEERQKAKSSRSVLRCSCWARWRGEEGGSGREASGRSDILRSR